MTSAPTYVKSLTITALASTAATSVYFYFIDMGTRLFGEVAAPLVPYVMTWLCLLAVVFRFGPRDQLGARVLRMLIIPLVLAAGVVFAGYLTTWVVGSALYRGIHAR